MWNSIIMPETLSLGLDYLADAAGYNGLEDGVARHWNRIIAVGVGTELVTPETVIVPTLIVMAYTGAWLSLENQASHLHI